MNEDTQTPFRSSLVIIHPRRKRGRRPPLRGFHLFTAPFARMGLFTMQRTVLLAALATVAGAIQLSELSLDVISFTPADKHALTNRDAITVTFVLSSTTALPICCHTYTSATMPTHLRPSKNVQEIKKNVRMPKKSRKTFETFEPDSSQMNSSFAFLRDVTASISSTSGETPQCECLSHQTPQCECLSCSPCECLSHHLCST